jgi:hypothetical protein
LSGSNGLQGMVNHIGAASASSRGGSSGDILEMLDGGIPGFALVSAVVASLYSRSLEGCVCRSSAATSRPFAR